MNDKGLKSSVVKSGKRYNVIMSEGLHECIKQYAEREDLSVSGAICSILLDEFYNEYEKIFPSQGGSLISAADLYKVFVSYNKAAKRFAPLKRKQVSFILPTELSNKIERCAEYIIMSSSKVIRALIYSSYTNARM